MIQTHVTRYTVRKTFEDLEPGELFKLPGHPWPVYKKENDVTASVPCTTFTSDLLPHAIVYCGKEVARKDEAILFEAQCEQIRAFSAGEFDRAILMGQEIVQWIERVRDKFLNQET